MASFLSLYNDIEYKIKQGTLRLKENENKIRQLNETVERLEAENSNLQQQVLNLNEKLQLITITKTVLTKEDKKETKKKINDLVRDIDECIGLLNRI